jgi:membrane-associated phospholipid phosphatase
VTTTLGPAQELDRRLLRWLRERGHEDPRVVNAIASFSRTGEHAACWFVLGALGVATSSRGSHRRRAFRRGVLVTGIAYGLNTAVKFAVKRPRPELEDLPPLTPVVTGLSFPSAHATTSFAAAAAYSSALPLAAPLFYGAATMFALSRPYLGVHYPSDVVAGAALGTATGRLLRCR